MGSASEAVQLARKSVGFDVRLLLTKELPLLWRIQFLALKYPKLLKLLTRRPVRLRLRANAMVIRDFAALGTLQSAILDVRDTLVATEIFDRPDPLIIDVGANIGQFTNAVKLFLPGARVIAFEPDPEVFRDLEINTSRMPDVELHNVAIGERSETLPFRRLALSVMSTFSEVFEPSDVRGVVELPLQRLDDEIGKHLLPDLVKIDVEGYEWQALQGAVETLRRARYLLIEVSLGRQLSGESNLRVLRSVVDIVPSARAVKFGRPLGEEALPYCQDILVALTGSR